MPRSFIRQIEQIWQSDTYNDALTMANAESSATNIEDDLNYLRTQERVITGELNWFDPPQASLSTLALKTFILWKQKTDDVTVSAGNNFVLLTGATKPSENIAINSTTIGAITVKALGATKLLNAAAAVDKTGGLVGIPLTGNGYAPGDSITIAGSTNYNGTFILDATSSVNEMVITATYNAETFAGTETAIKNMVVGAHSLTAEANRSNIVEIRDAATNDIIYAESIGVDKQQIYGLLQVGVGATDGNAFGDSGADQAQLSFVYINPSTEALVAVPVVDIEGKVIEYAYKRRINFKNLPETAFDPTVTFVESLSLSTIDLQDVYNNDADGSFSLTSGKNYTVDLAGNANAQIKDGSSSYLLTDKANTLLKLGQDTILTDGQTLRFGDVGNSNFVGFQAPALTADTTYTWPAAAVNGLVLGTDTNGILSWVNLGRDSKKAIKFIGSDVSANTAINLSTFVNPDSMAFGSSAANWVKDFDVYLNGVLQPSGVDADVNNNCYYVSSTELAFEFALKANRDEITIIQRKVS